MKFPSWRGAKKSESQRRQFLIPSSGTTSRAPRKQVRNRALRLWESLGVLKKLQQYLHLSAIGWVVIILMALFVSFAFFSPYFQLKRIDIIRQDATFDVQAVEEALEPIKGKNLLFLSNTEVSNLLLSTFPTFRSVQLTEIWPDAIELEIMEAPPAFLLENGFDAKTTVVTDDGVAIRRYSDEILPRYKLLQYDRPVQPGTRILTLEEIILIGDLKDLMLSELGFIPDEIRVLWAAREIHFVVKGRGVFWFDMTLPAIDSIERLVASADTIGLFERSFEHIDLRIPEHIYALPN